MESDRNENFTGEVTAAVSSSTDITTKKGFDDAEQTENLEVSTCTQHDPCSASKQTVTEEKEAKKTLQSEITQLAPGEGNDSLETASDFTSENEPVIKSANQIPSGAEADTDDFFKLGDDVRLVLLGKTGSGKSATGNTILGQKLFKESSSASSITHICRGEHVKRFEKNIHVIDTPGLFDTHTGLNIQKEISTCITLSAPGPHAFILVLGLTRFTIEENEAVNHFVKRFGEDVFNFFIILFTRRDDLDYENKTLDEHLNEIPKNLEEIINKCGNRCIAFNNRADKFDKEEQVKNLLKMIQENIIRNRRQYYTDEMYAEATRLMELKAAELEKEAEMKRQREMKKIKEEIENSFKAKIDEQEELIEASQQKYNKLTLDFERKEKEHRTRLHSLESKYKAQHIEMTNDNKHKNQQITKMKEEIQNLKANMAEIKFDLNNEKNGLEDELNLLKKKKVELEKELNKLKKEKEWDHKKKEALEKAIKEAEDEKYFVVRYWHNTRRWIGNIQQDRDIEKQVDEKFRQSNKQDISEDVHN